MPASRETVRQVVVVMERELGLSQSLRLLRALKAETTGNASYVTTLAYLFDEMADRLKDRRRKADELRRLQAHERAQDDADQAGRREGRGY